MSRFGRDIFGRYLVKIMIYVWKIFNRDIFIRLYV